MNKSGKLKGTLLLLITSIIWGSAFAAQKAGTSIPPCWYNGLRNILGALSLLPLILIVSSKKDKRGIKETKEDKKYLLKGGIIAGIFLAAGSTLQQLGIYLGTDAGKAGFITALYIIIVPVLGIFMNRKVRPLIWFCVLIGAIGFWFLTLAGTNTGFKLETGDFFLLLCTLAFSFHIMTIDHFAPHCDGLKFSALQFLTAGIIPLALAIPFEKVTLTQIIACAWPIFYGGVMSCGVAYTLQFFGQKSLEPAAASLILSLESVFAVISGMILFGESLTPFETCGCILILLAVSLSQKPEKKKKL